MATPGSPNTIRGTSITPNTPAAALQKLRDRGADDCSVWELRQALQAPGADRRSIERMIARRTT